MRATRRQFTERTIDRLSFIRRRLAEFSNSWITVFGRNEVLHWRWVSANTPVLQRDVILRHPYWKLLPIWLAQVYGRRRVPRAVLNDILWGQYCLFKVIRIQDDLFDGHVTTPSLIYVSDQFLIEAERVFARHFEKSSSFWHHYRTALRTTTQTIVVADALQKKPVALPQRLLKLFPRVNSIFAIGPLAVCLTAKAPASDRRRIYRLTGSFAIIGQVLDDFKDLKPDLDRKRYNSVASFLPGRSKGPRASPSSRQTLTHLSQSLLSPAITSKFFRLMYQEFNQAEKDLRALLGEHREALRYLRGYRTSVEKLEKELHIQRVKFLLQNVMT